MLSSIFCVLLCFSSLCFPGHPCYRNLSMGKIIPPQVVELPSNNNFQFIPRFLHYLSERLICQTAAQVLCSLQVQVQETIAIGLSDFSQLLLNWRSNSNFLAAEVSVLSRSMYLPWILPPASPHIVHWLPPPIPSLPLPVHPSALPALSLFQGSSI